VLVRLAQLVVDRAEIVAVDLELAFTAKAGLRTVLANVEVAPWPADADPASRLAVRPYPAELERRMTLEDGRQVLLRPIRPEDAGAVARTFGRLSADDARFRLFAPLRELPIELVARLTQIDYDREMALVAEDPASPGELLGGARVSMEPDGRRAEFAVTVRTDGQGHGLGRCTLEAVLDYARQRGVEEVWGTILADNHRMLGLAKALGFALRRDPDEPDAVLAVKRLDGTA
jgi:acetyltransferase